MCEMFNIIKINSMVLVFDEMFGDVRIVFGKSGFVFFYSEFEVSFCLSNVAITTATNNFVHKI